MGIRMKFYILLLASLISSVSSEFCGLPYGSPIDIPTNKALPLEAEDGLILSKFCRPLSGTFENDGKNLVFLPDLGANDGGCTQVLPFMTKGPFEDDTFEFNRMVVFWGNETGLGSEHAFDGEKADAELQMVFTKTTYEKDLDAALAAEYGVAILSIMINGDNASDEENWFTLFETAATATFNATANNQMPVNQNQNVTISMILGDIIDPLTTAVSSEFDYYFYVGSYNFEPCNQNVFWIVAEPIASVTSDQLSYLTNMIDVDGLNITSNFREQQGYDCRKILTSLDN